ncbi:DnaD domain protein [Aerococcus agrisoli]|uniref:DnaD domain protein n=1 Tax=Aerococcus agrisoli TaxID=2487350 RepID=A0A3N4GGF2_9LACT|nr:DnaD domain protein [Aerococcus agrisoli]RPA61255.1 DnaD domain protein [Aerococcus agrisoli]
MNREYYTVMRNKVLESYHRLNISNEEMMLLIHFLSFQQAGEEFPAISAIGQRMNLPETTLFDMIQSLIEKGFLSIPSYKNAEGKSVEFYSLDPLYQKIESLDQVDKTSRFQEAQATKEGEVFEMIQTEFGRQLSPIEYQQIAEWFSKDHYEPEVVKEALKEAILNQVYSLKYIDRILLNWAKQKKTKANDTRRSNHYNQQNTNKQELPPVPMKKWLNK